METLNNSKLQSSNQNIPKFLLFFLLGIFIIILIFSSYLLAKIDKKSKTSQTEDKTIQNQTSDTTVSAQNATEFIVTKRNPQGVDVGDESGTTSITKLESVSISFNNKANPKTINNDTFYVLTDATTKADGKISYNNKTKTATLTFTNPIVNEYTYITNNNTRVTVVVKNIKDTNDVEIQRLTYNIDIKQ